MQYERGNNQIDTCNNVPYIQEMYWNDLVQCINYDVNL